MQPTTYFGLLAEFGQVHIPITVIAQKYFGYDEPQAKRAAAVAEYPFPVFRAGSNKSPWLVDINHLAAYLDRIKDKAQQEYKAAK